MKTLVNLTDQEKDKALLLEKEIDALRGAISKFENVDFNEYQIGLINLVNSKEEKLEILLNGKAK